VYVIEPERGLVWFDRGQDRASVTVPAYFPGGLTGALYRRLTKFEIAESQTLTAQFGALGYPMSDVHSVVLSHLHQDHIGGLSEVSAALLHVSRAEWNSKTRRRPELHAVMPDHIDLPGLRWKQVDFDARTHTSIVRSTHPSTCSTTAA
jgi:glyoxylase-like metal-dependent hydrolase (beta-lactamase superfamily II)